MYRRPTARRRAQTTLFRIFTGYISLSLLTSGCTRETPSTLAPEGPAALEIARLGWLLFVLGGATFVAVMAFLFISLFRRQGRDVQPEVRAKRDRKIVVGGGIVFPAIILAIVYGLTLYTMASLRTPVAASNVVIEVVGREWWWEVHYPDPGFTTANEIHIPVGQPVTINLTSAGVIHSFWVPRLHGKLDLIPGRTTSFWIQADEAGEYWGECAEFCGIQHAKMAFVVIAEPAGQFAAWLEQQRRPARPPSSELAQKGLQLFFEAECAFCHAVAGTEAAGDLGPDLTHVASRRTLGAGTLPNSPENLAGWTIDSQAFKPGNLMPVTVLPDTDLEALLAYLETLE